MLVIGGYSEGFLSDVELLNFNSNDDECNPPNLNYAVSHHKTIKSSRGLITCGGYDKNWNLLSNCSIQKSNGEIKSIPSMVTRNINFGMVNVNETLYAIGGIGTFNTMETINLNNDTKWKKENLDNWPSEYTCDEYRCLATWSLTAHCVVNIRSKIFVIGGARRLGKSFSMVRKNYGGMIKVI